MADGYAEGGKRVLRDSRGNLVQVSPEKAQQFIEQGDARGNVYAPVSAAELQELNQRAEANTVGGQLSTFGTQAAEGLYGVLKGAANLAGNANGASMYGMGATQAPMTAEEQAAFNEARGKGLFAGVQSAQAGADVRSAGGMEYQAQQASEQATAAEDQAQRIQQEENPLVAGAGRMAGESLPFVAVPGMGALGGAAAKGIGGLATGALGRAAASKIGQFAVQGALEGGLQGAVMGATDPDATAEDILASVGMGAVLGGGVSGGFGVAGAALGGLAQAGKKGVGKLGNAINDASGGTLLGKYQDFAAKITDVDPAIMREVGPGGTRAAEAWDASRNIADEINTASIGIAPKITQAHNDLADVLKTVRESTAKQRGIREIMGDAATDPDMIANARDMISSHKEALLSKIDELQTARIGGSGNARAEMAAAQEQAQAAVATAKKKVLSLGKSAPVEQVARDAEEAAQRSILEAKQRLADASGRDATVEARKALNEAQETLRQAKQATKDAQLRISSTKQAAESAELITAKKELIDAQEQLASVKKTASGAGDSPFVVSSAKVRKDFEKLKRTVAQEFDNSLASADLADIFSAGDVTKRTIGRVVDDLNKMVDPRISGNLGLTPQEMRFITSKTEGIRNSYKDYMAALEAPEYFTEGAAAAQKAVNKAFTEDGIKAINRFRQEFTRDTGDLNWDSGLRISEGKADSLKNYFSSLGKAENQVREEAMELYLSRVEPLIDAVGEHYSLAPAQKEALARAKASIAEIKQARDVIADRVQLVDKLDKVNLGEKNVGGGAVNAAILGGVVGGLPGAALGAAAGSLMKPSTVGKAINIVQGISQRFSNNSIGELGRWVTNGASRTSSVADSYRRGIMATGKSALGKSRRPVSSASVAAFLGGFPSSTDAYEARSKEVADMDPNEVASDLKALGYPDSVALAAAQTTQKAQQYLASLVPSWRRPNGIAPAVKVPPSLAERYEFSLAFGAISQPETVISDIMAGSVSPAQVKALEFVYPRMYQRMVQAVGRSVELANSSGNAFPLHKRQMLAVMMNAPELGVLSVSAVDSVASALSYQEQPQAKQQQARPSAAPQQSISPAQEFLNS